jgi:hypothetical protein
MLLLFLFLFLFLSVVVLVGIMFQVVVLLVGGGTFLLSVGLKYVYECLNWPNNKIKTKLKTVCLFNYIFYMKKRNCQKILNIHSSDLSFTHFLSFQYINF